MKELYNVLTAFTILMVMFMFSNTAVFADAHWEKENKLREETFKNTLNEYLQEFMNDSTPEQDRIKKFEFSGYGVSNSNKEFVEENKLAVSITFNVEPYNEDNTTWLKYNNHCFAKYTKTEDGNYKLDSISRYPDNYDKFMQKFEEWKQNGKQVAQTETVSIKGENNNILASKELQTINFGILTICGLIFAISIISFVVVLRNRK